MLMMPPAYSFAGTLNNSATPANAVDDYYAGFSLPPPSPCFFFSLRAMLAAAIAAIRHDIDAATLMLMLMLLPICH